MAKRNPRSDTAAPDGIFSHGYRLVRPGGRVKAADTWFQHDALIPYVGTTVYVMVNDYWYSELICITDEQRTEILGRIQLQSRRLHFFCLWKTV